MTGRLPTLLKVRKNGSQWPPSPWQVTSTGLVAFFTVSTHALCLCVPGFIAWLAVQDLLLLVLLLAAIYTMNVNAGVQKGDKFKPFIEANYEYIDYAGYCHACEMKMPPRSKHCNYCHKCVHRFDHHCFVLNNCVGASNYHGFLTVLFTAVLFLFSVAIQSATAMALYFTEHDIKPTFAGTLIDYRLWTALLALNILLGLAPMIEFLPVVRVQIICLHRGITQFEYYKSLSEARKAKEAEKEAKKEKETKKEKEAKKEDKDIQIVVVSSQTAGNVIDIGTVVKDIATAPRPKPAGRILEPDFSWLKDTPL